MSGSSLAASKKPIFKWVKKQEAHQKPIFFEEEQAAAFQRERERKASRVKAREDEEKGRVGKFLNYVVEGEQDKAEALLKSDSRLALQKGMVTDLSKRKFKDITGFQYALWALDWHMWKMLLEYMSVEAAALQFAELEEKGTAHGKHFSLAPLIKALNTYAKHYSNWCNANAGNKIKHYWWKVVGGSQLLLPAHVVHEYCHPTRSFYPCPGFREESLPRSRQLFGNRGEWFTCEYNGGKLGDRFGVIRYNNRKAGYRLGITGDDVVVKQEAVSDAETLQSLSTVRQLQLESLKSELEYLTGVNDLLETYFPPVLSSTVIAYLS